MELAKNLWVARGDTGLSRERVVRLLTTPLSAKTLERWEKGERKPTEPWLSELAELYGVSVADLTDKEAA